MRYLFIIMIILSCDYLNKLLRFAYNHITIMDIDIMVSNRYNDNIDCRYIGIF